MGESCKNRKTSSSRERSVRRAWAVALLTSGVIALSLGLAGCGGASVPAPESAVTTSVPGTTLEQTTLQRTTLEQTTLEQTTTTAEAAEVPSIKVVADTDTKDLREKGSVTFTYRIYNTGDEPLSVLAFEDEKMDGFLLQDDAEAAWEAAGEISPIVIDATNPDSYFEFKHTAKITFPKGEADIKGTTTVFGESVYGNTGNATGSVDWTVSREVTASGPGQAEVVASLPNPIPCVMNEYQGRREWHYTITFVENNGVDAIIDKLAERFIDKEGKAWVQPQRGDLLIGDKQIPIPAKWSNSYSNYVVQNRSGYGFEGWSLEMNYGGTDKNGNRFSGSVSAKFSSSP